MATGQLVKRPNNLRHAYYHLNHLHNCTMKRDMLVRLCPPTLLCCATQQLVLQAKMQSVHSRKGTSTLGEVQDEV